MSTTNTVRITKSQKYNAAIVLLEGGNPVVIPGKDGKAGVTMDAAYICDFFRDELALLAKKNTNTGDKKKLTKAQEKNEQYKALILSHLRANPSLMVTATDMYDVLRNAYPDELWSNQKSAALLNALSDKLDPDTGELISVGPLNRVQGRGKNKTTFQLKPEYVAEDEIEE